MRQQVEKVTEPETTPEVTPDYDPHIKVRAEVRSVLRDSTELAYKMVDIPKPDLVDLMNLFIGWDLKIQKKSGSTVWAISLPPH